MKITWPFAILFCWIFFVLLVFETYFDTDHIRYVNIYVPDAWAMYNTTVTEPMTIQTKKSVIIYLSNFQNISGNALTVITDSGNNTISYCTLSNIGGYGVSLNSLRR